jgi:hypothetical protein
MSIFGDIGNFVSNAASTVAGAVASTVGEVASDVSKVGLGVIEGGIDTVGDIIKNPTELLNPFELLKGAAGNIYNDVSAQFADGSSPAPTASSTGGSNGQGFGVLDSLGGQINDLRNQLMNLDPNSPNYAADSMKLTMQLQVAQQQFQQISDTLTNGSKKQDEGLSNITRNLA